MTLTATSSDLQQITESMGRVAKLWLDPKWQGRQEAVSALQVSTGFSRSMVENALRAAFEELTTEKITAYCAQESAFDRRAHAPESVLHIAAGNVFTAWLPGAVTTLLLGSRCDLKPSMQEPVFANLWKRSVESVNPVLAHRIHCVKWEESLPQRYPAVVAYGSDETLRVLQAESSPSSRFIGYGHKLSAAVIFKNALSQEALPSLIQQLEKDIQPFNLAGCLSPQIIYIEGEDPGLLESLLQRVNVMPRMKRFEEGNELKAELKTFASSVSALGYAGSFPEGPAFESDLYDMGFSRICRIGEMQQPPLTWKNGGFSLADVLTGS